MLSLIRKLIIAIAVVTVISGVVQAIAPAFILGLVHAEIDPTTTQAFAIVGFFMALFGGLLIQCLAFGPPVLPGVLWSGLQKVGASAAVFIGIHRGVFSGFAAAVASFDGLSAVLILGYYWAVRRAGIIP